jgi:ABC-type dipeptide/oligopeptide/nickel transport system permease subunit
MQHAFAAFGPQGPMLFHQLIQAIRVSLATAITNVFFLGCITMLLGLLTTLFLREIPLRKAHAAQEAQAMP